ncbi:MAG: amino acid carrier protein [Gammaproteobacteria bacterium]|nr:amino acid carrier protein [Gammaproteobacteria bacterium]
MGFMDTFSAFIGSINDFLYQDTFLFVLLGTGILFTVWSGFAQYRALTHGTAVLRGFYDDKADPGAINHFQALSAALSATVGLGNIGGVALAVALGGPGAVFWMWMVGILGMSIKITEVTLSMIYRNTDDPNNPHGGPMWVVSKGLAAMNPKYAGVGKLVGWFFCITLLIYTITGGAMFQAWNVGDITQEYFHVPSWIVGIVLAVIVWMVIIGGIKRIGHVAGSLVPLMVVLYLLGGLAVLISNYEVIPDMLRLIVVSAFSPQEASGAFIGGTVGYAIMIGMKRALFSSEAGAGSSPIAHSAAKTDEPVREGVVAGLEPFIDTIVVCTFTALVILSSGIWERSGEGMYDTAPMVVPVEGPGYWSLETTEPPARAEGEWREGENVFVIIEGDTNKDTNNRLHRLDGEVVVDGDRMVVEFGTIAMTEKPTVNDLGLYATYPGATLTAKAFDSAFPGLGKWLVTLAAWLFAISTMISWSYYGEQGIVYMFGEGAVKPYKYMFCVLVFVATLGFITTPTDLDNFSSLGVGVMLWVNVPIMLFFGHQAMKAYKEYIGRLKRGEMPQNPDKPSFFKDVLTGRDVD